MEEKRTSVKNSENFEIKYRVILEKLKQMPIGGEKPEDSERWIWFRQLADHDDMVKDLIGCISPKGYEMLLYGLDSGTEGNRFRKGLNTEVLFEALLECVNRFTGVNAKGKEYKFTQYFILRYKQLADRKSSKNYLQKEGMTMMSSDRRMPVLRKLIREVLTLTESRGDGKVVRDIDDIINECVKASKYTYTKEEIQDAKAWLSLNIVSMDVFVDDEKEISIGDMIPDHYDPYERINETNDEMNIVCRIATRWDDVVVPSTRKTDRNLVKAFLSRNILIELKLRKLSPDYLEELKKDKSWDYTRELEPYCKKWCPSRESCRYAEGHRCYVRWGRLNDKEPAGDKEIYEAMKNDEDVVYQKILKNDYVSYAFERPPEKLYDLYANVLKDFGQGENSFEFTDAVIARGLGMRKDAVSKGKTKYEGKIKALLRNVFLEQE